MHSGVYGGPVGDALTGLCRLLATLHDDQGDVAVAGAAPRHLGGAGSGRREFRADVGLVAGR